MPHTTQAVCATQDVILTAKNTLDELIMNLRAGSALFGTKLFRDNKDKPEAINAIQTLFDTLQEQVTPYLLEYDPTVAELIILSFGDGTRFKDWLDEQRVGTISALAVAYSTFIKQAKPLSQKSLPMDSIQTLIDTEATFVKRLALSVPFLDRILTSDNTSAQEKRIIDEFKEQLVAVREHCVRLNPESIADNLNTHYNTDDYWVIQQQLENLRDVYLQNVKPILTKAEQINSGILPGKFHWHLGSSIEIGLNVLDNLDNRDTVTALLQQHTPSLLTDRQNHIDHLLGQRLMRDLIIQQLPETATKVDVGSRRVKMALGLIAHFDNDMPVLPDALKANQAFQRGCLEELLLVARPNVFTRDTDTGAFCVRKDVEQSKNQTLLNVVNLKAQLDPEQFQRPSSSSAGLDPLSELLCSIKPLPNTFNAAEQTLYTDYQTLRYAKFKEKVTSYTQLIEYLATEKLKLNATPDLTISTESKPARDQARSMAEKLLWLILANKNLGGVYFNQDLLENLSKVQDKIASNFVERAAKNIAYQTGLKEEKITIEDETIQKLYREIDGLNSNDLAKLTNRVQTVYAKDIELLEDLAERFTHRLTMDIRLNPSETNDSNPTHTQRALKTQLQELSEEEKESNNRLTNEGGPANHN